MNNISVEQLNIGDVVSFISKRFNYRDNDKIWFVIEKDAEFISLQADDSHLIKLSPPRGKNNVLINFKYWYDFKINKHKNK